MDLLSAFTTQWEQAKHFWCTPALRLPILNIWVATFGGALHAPCTTFFLLELGLTNTEIGNGGMLMSFPDLILAPLYGYAFDRFGAYPVICTTAACCAFGCLVRGFATSVAHVYLGSLIIGMGASNLWVSVLSHISQHTETDRREACVSAFVFQVATLRILGKSAWWWLHWSGLMQAPKESRLGRYMQKADPFPDRDRNLDSLARNGVRIMPRLMSAAGSIAQFSDGSATEVVSVVWAVGFRDDSSWVEIAGAGGSNGSFVHTEGVSEIPNLFFVGRPWQRNRASALIMGAGPDAAAIVKRIVCLVTAPWP